MESLPSYGTATGCPTLPPPVYVPDSPAHLFVGTDNQSEMEEQIHPENHEDSISESSVIHTNLCEWESNVWLSNFCCGLWCHSFAGKLTNWKVNGSSISDFMYTVYIFVSLAGLGLLGYSIYELVNFSGYSNTWTIIARVNLKNFF